LALADDIIDIVCLTDRPSGVSRIAAAASAAVAGWDQSTARRPDEPRLTSTTQLTRQVWLTLPLPSGILQCRISQICNF